MAEATDDYPPVMDAAQVARLLQLNIDYVRKLTREGVLPARRLPGGRAFRYLRDEVLDWLRSQPAVGAEITDEVTARADGAGSA